MTKIHSGIKVIAPATLSNLGSGQGIMALALEGISDEIIIHQSEVPGVSIKEITGDGNRLSLNWQENTAGYAAHALLQFMIKEHEVDPSIGVELHLRKKVPIGKGLGSSAASAVAGVMAINAFFGSPLEKKQLLPFAYEAESLYKKTSSLASVAASLLGGWIIVANAAQLDIRRLLVPRGLHWVIAFANNEPSYQPDLENNQYNYSTIVQQNEALASLIYGLNISDLRLIAQSLQDYLVEPELAKNYPLFPVLKNTAIESGALSVGFSGMGSSIFAFCQNSNFSDKVATSLKAVYSKDKIRCTIYNTTFNQEGAESL